MSSSPPAEGKHTPNAESDSNTKDDITSTDGSDERKTDDSAYDLSDPFDSPSTTASPGGDKSKDKGKGAGARWVIDPAKKKKESILKPSGSRRVGDDPASDPLVSMRSSTISVLDRADSFNEQPYKPRMGTVLGNTSSSFELQKEEKEKYFRAKGAVGLWDAADDLPAPAEFKEKFFKSKGAVGLGDVAEKEKFFQGQAKGAVGLPDVRGTPPRPGGREEKGKFFQSKGAMGVPGLGGTPRIEKEDKEKYFRGTGAVGLWDAGDVREKDKNPPRPDPAEKKAEEKAEKDKASAAAAVGRPKGLPWVDGLTKDTPKSKEKFFKASGAMGLWDITQEVEEEKPKPLKTKQKENYFKSTGAVGLWDLPQEGGVSVKELRRESTSLRSLDGTTRGKRRPDDYGMRRKSRASAPRTKSMRGTISDFPRGLDVTETVLIQSRFQFFDEISEDEQHISPLNHVFFTRSEALTFMKEKLRCSEAEADAAFHRWPNHGDIKFFYPFTTQLLASPVYEPPKGIAQLAAPFTVELAQGDSMYVLSPIWRDAMEENHLIGDLKGEEERKYYRHRWLMEWGGQRGSDHLFRYYFGNNVLKVCTGWMHTVALCSDGRVYVWGEQSAGGGELGLGDKKRIIQKPMLQPTLLFLENGYRTISCGPKFSAAVSEDAMRVYCWGSMTDQLVSLVPTKYFEIKNNHEVLQSKKGKDN